MEFWEVLGKRRSTRAFDDEEVKEILKCDPNLKPVAILPIGYPAETPEPHSRRKLEDLVHKV